MGACSVPACIPPYPAAQALHWAWQRNERLWQLSTPVGAFMALEMGALAEAVHGYQHRAAPQAAATTWVAAHYEAAALALAVVNSAALAASTACLLAASAGLGAGRGRREDGDAAEPLLGGEEGRRKRRRAKGSTRMRLISGTLRYVVPDTPALKIRRAAGGWVVGFASDMARCRWQLQR